MLSITDREYESLNVAEDYYEFFRDLKQRILFFIHLHYTDDEIMDLVKSSGLGMKILEIISSYILSVRNNNRRMYVTERNKNILLRMWYTQYLDFGKKEGGSHFPDLLIFQFQIEEIDKLLTEFSQYLTNETKKIIDNILEKLYNNQYNSFKPILTEYYKSFGVKYKIIDQPSKEKIIGIPGKKHVVDYVFPEEHDFGAFIGEKENRPIVSFISKLRLIVLGGGRSQQGKYIPFFMEGDNIVSEINGYMKSRLDAVIKKYYPRFLTRKSIPSAVKRAELVENLLNLPIINFTVFQYIDWDFIPEDMFYDGVCVKKPRGKQVIYTIQTHPLNLFLVFYFKDIFELFLDQLLHHEFIHLLQYRVSYIYDNIISNDKFKRENPVEYKLLYTLANTHWINELKSSDNQKGYDPKTSRFKTLEMYILSYGGHTPRFMKEVNKFEECKKTMVLRGKIETLYASFYFKNYGHDFKKGYWYLCSPK